MVLALPNATDHDGILNHGGHRGHRGRLGSRLTPPSTKSTISIPSNISNLLMRAFALVLSTIATVGLTRDLGAQVQPPTGRGAVQTTPPRWIPDPESQLLPAPVPATVKDGFRLVTLGDLLYWRPVRAQIDSAMESALRLVRDADFATANHEGTFFDLHTKHIPPQGGGVLMVGPPE